jgi:hypothetical protein
LRPAGKFEPYGDAIVAMIEADRYGQHVYALWKEINKARELNVALHKFPNLHRRARVLARTRDEFADAQASMMLGLWRRRIWHF